MALRFDRVIVEIRFKIPTIVSSGWGQPCQRLSYIAAAPGGKKNGGRWSICFSRRVAVAGRAERRWVRVASAGSETSLRARLAHRLEHAHLAGESRCLGSSDRFGTWCQEAFGAVPEGGD